MVGHETSAATLVFTLLELARNPTIQENLRREVQTMGHLNYDRVQQLEYLDAVVKEGYVELLFYPINDKMTL